MYRIKIVLVRAVIVMMLALLPQAAHATKISDQESANYYKACNANRSTTMAAETQDEMCACTAAQMQRAMSVEDVSIMRENTTRGRAMLNKMLLQVYGPCMGSPMADLISAECDKNPQIALADQTMDRREICGCMAERVSQWFQEEGVAIMTEVLKETPNITDPTGPVYESKVYKEAEHEIMMSCIVDIQDGPKKRSTSR